MTQHAPVGAPETGSALFAALCERFDDKAPTFGDVMQFAGPRAYPLILLVFALPEALPLPVAGMSTILAVPLLLISLQMMVNGPEPRLPAWLNGRRISLRLFKTGSAMIGNLLRRIERLSRARWPSLARRTRLVGAVCFLLAAVIALPIPFGNMLPALCVIGMAVGMLQRDGVLVAVSMAAGGLVLSGLVAAVVALSGAVVSWTAGMPA